MKSAHRKRTPCTACGVFVWRWEVRKDTVCHECMMAGRRAAYLRRKVTTDKDPDARRKANPEKYKAYRRAYWAKNKARLNRYHRTWQREQARRLRAALALVPCLECGQSHSIERRLAILRRMAGFKAMEIREAYPCVWGTELHSAGETRFYRDLAILEKQTRRAA